MLSLKNVSKTYVTERLEGVQALNGISFELPPGEFLGVVGPTGCGKTTLLRLIAGLEKADSGEIIMPDTKAMSPAGRCGMVFQQHSLFPWRTVIGNIAFGLEVQGMTKAHRLERAKKMLELVGLNKFARAYPYELSGGMQQRAAIARALAANPETLLMDEPFGALDERTRYYMQNELLAVWSEEKKSVIFVTHNIDEAIYLSDRVIIISGQPGEIVRDMNINLIRPRNRLAKEFLDYHLAIREVLETTIMNQPKK
jgi:NitT/TauT family transport system ATP-binding protein